MNRILTLFLTSVIVLSAAARAGEAIPGKDVTFTGTVPMTAFLQTSAGLNGMVHFDAWEVRDGKTVLAYDIDMTKIMHMIVVSDDLTDFQHVHPTLLPNGHLVIDMRLKEASAAYHVYLDGRPKDNGRHVFRFDLPGVSPGAAPNRVLHASGASLHVGPYTVEIDPTDLPIGEISTVSVRILKDGKPATDLHPYLGVMAHGVFIGVNDLAYMHAHGMSASMLNMASGANDCGDSMMMQMSPLQPNQSISNEFEFQVLAPSAQAYDFWLQFIGGTTLYTAPMLVTTR